MHELHVNLTSTVGGISTLLLHISWDGPHTSDTALILWLMRVRSFARCWKYNNFRMISVLVNGFETPNATVQLESQGFLSYNAVKRAIIQHLTGFISWLLLHCCCNELNSRIFCYCEYLQKLLVEIYGNKLGHLKRSFKNHRASKTGIRSTTTRKQFLSLKPLWW